jgi:hypothetical protein
VLEQAKNRARQGNKPRPAWQDPIKAQVFKMLNSLRSHKPGLLAMALMPGLALAAAAFAANKNPCPPVKPKTSPAKLAQSMHNASTPQEIQKILAAQSRVIRKPATWSGCHTIRDTLKIKAPVTVAPGAVLRFKANAGLTIEQNGSLDATGTQKQPVVFTATDETAGYWYGIYYKSHSSHNRLIFTKVLYAGGIQVGTNGMTLSRAGGDSNPPSRANFVLKTALLSVEHSQIAHSGGYGLEILGDLGTFAENRVEHTQVPMRLRLDNVGHLAASNIMTGNDKQQIDVIGNKTLTRDSTWQDFGVPYNLRFYITISANLTLKPGVVLLMGDDDEMDVEENGSLNAVGTAAKPIVIRGGNENPGYWDDIVFSSHSAKNVFKYVRVADGGGGDTHPANIDDEGRLELEHSWIENSRGAGVLVDQFPGVNAVLKAADNKFKGNKINITIEH